MEQSRFARARLATLLTTVAGDASIEVNVFPEEAEHLGDPQACVEHGRDQHRSRGAQTASRRSISSRPSTRWRRRCGRGRSSDSSRSTGSAMIQPRRRAKRMTLCSVSSALAEVLPEQPLLRSRCNSSATPSTTLGD
jgi:hypothetical protein